MEQKIIALSGAIKILIVAMVLGMPVNDLMATIKTIITVLG